ncbi:hypothetical protein G4B88_026951 [Cannabis sativa]|uniref:RNase H type-1 domain-containing protein n=1 Tax=Cannabis sativa TaxID=3483 RepID=A0A7J6EGS4_CANSA|nr:hypothetical protein G4B88_026951 [Cannabis sativa]
MAFLTYGRGGHEEMMCRRRRRMIADDFQRTVPMYGPWIRLGSRKKDCFSDYELYEQERLNRELNDVRFQTEARNNLIPGVENFEPALIGTQIHLEAVVEAARNGNAGTVQAEETVEEIPGEGMAVATTEEENYSLISGEGQICNSESITNVHGNSARTCSVATHKGTDNGSGPSLPTNLNSKGKDKVVDELDSHQVDHLAMVFKATLGPNSKSAHKKASPIARGRPADPNKKRRLEEAGLDSSGLSLPFGSEVTLPTKKVCSENTIDNQITHPFENISSSVNLEEDLKENYKELRTTESDFFSSNLPALASPVAKGIWATKNFIADNTIWLIGRESKVNIWSSWSGGDGLFCDSRDINPRVKENICVGDLMVDSGNDWNYNLEALPFGSKLQSIFGSCPGPCSLCGDENGDTVTHFAVHCIVTNHLWFASKWNLHMNSFLLENGRDVADWLVSPPFSQNWSSRERDEFTLYGTIVYHKLWSVRNDMFHNETPLGLEALRSAVDKCFNEHMATLRPDTENSEQGAGIGVIRWGLPRPGRVKCFVDYASNSDGGAVAAVLFNHDGFVKCFGAKKVNVASVLHGELEALLFGLWMAGALDVEEVDCFSDCQLLVHALADGSSLPWNVFYSFNKLLNVLVENHFSVSWTPREANGAAHDLAKWGLTHTCNDFLHFWEI